MKQISMLLFLVLVSVCSAQPVGWMYNQPITVRNPNSTNVDNPLVTHFGKNEPTGNPRYRTLFNFGTQAQLAQIQVSEAATHACSALALPSGSARAQY